MNQEQVLAWAREAGGFRGELPKGDAWMFFEDAYIERFAALVAAHERENFANLREEIILYGAPNEDYEDGFWDGLASYEAAIKARSHK